MAIFTMETEVTDASVYANNATKYYQNKVNLRATGIDQNASTGVTISSTVIRKEKVGTYDYSTREMKWKLTLNQNKMEMTNPTVKDPLGEKKMELVAGSLMLGGTPIPLKGIGVAKPYYEINADGVLIVSLNDIFGAEVGTDSAKKTLSYTTRMTDEYEGYQKNSINSIQNVAKLTTAEYATEVSVDVTNTFTNQLIDKLESHDSATGIVTYSVPFNQARLLVPANLVIEDAMSENLQLDVSSVHLYRATVGVNGVLTATSTEETGYQKTVTKSGTDTILKIVMPNSTTNRNAYVLTYQAQAIDRDSECTNTVSVRGYANDVNCSKISSIGAGTFATGLSNGLRRAIVTKENVDGDKLEGAVFAIKKNGVVIATGETNAAGIVTFVGLARGQIYKIEEVSAPAGYQVSSYVWEFTGPENGGVANAARYTFVDERITPVVPTPTPVVPVTPSAPVVSQEPVPTPTPTPEPTAVVKKTRHSGGGGEQTSTPVPNTTPVAVPDTVMPTSEHKVQIPGTDTIVTDTDIMKEIVTIYQETDGEQKKAKEEALREKLRSILAQDDKFFENAPEEVKAYVEGLLKDGELTETLPKTGGFWGSGCMYLIGICCILAGVVIGCMSDDRRKRIQGILGKCIHIGHKIEK